MSQLTLEMFLAARRDLESSQFHILSGLQKIRREFAHNRIYPPLAELIDLYRTLKTITDGSAGIREELPRRIRSLDLENRRIIFEPFDVDGDAIAAIEELIAWAMPQLVKAIEEGQTIFNFVDEHLSIGAVGLMPSYVEEGYLLVPEVASDMVHVLRYEITIFTGANENYRNLKTETVKSVPRWSLEQHPARVKQELIAERADLPNPATYLLSTDLDFPFSETILPIAKRKLLRQLYS